MYVCVCRGVTDRDIRVAVEEGASTLRQLRNQLGVSTQCGKCGPCAREILQDAVDEQSTLGGTVPA